MLEVGNSSKTRCLLVVKDAFILSLPWFLLVYLTHEDAHGLKLFMARVIDTWSTANSKHKRSILSEAFLAFAANFWDGACVAVLLSLGSKHTNDNKSCYCWRVSLLHLSMPGRGRIASISLKKKL
jgi:hypothetical protein